MPLLFKTQRLTRAIIKTDRSRQCQLATLRFSCSACPDKGFTSSDFAALHCIASSDFSELHYIASSDFSALQAVTLAAFCSGFGVAPPIKTGLTAWIIILYVIGLPRWSCPTELFKRRETYKQGSDVKDWIRTRLLIIPPLLYQPISH